MNVDEVAPGSPQPTGRRIRTRIAALALGFVLAPVVIELALQIASLFVSGDRSGGGSESALVLCQGDSNTFGLNLPTRSAYPAQLEALIREHGISAARVVNRGVPGKSSWVVRDELAADLERFHPRAVVVLCGVNDRDEIRPSGVLDRVLRRSRFVALLRRTWKGAEDHLEPPKPEPKLEPGQLDTEEIGEAEERISLRDRENESRSFVVQFGNPSASTAAHWLHDDLVEIVAIARRANVVPILCTYFENNAGFTPVNRVITETAAELGVMLVDTRPTFAEALKRVDRKKLVFPDYHLRAPGYSVYAAIVYDALVDAKLIDAARVDDPLASLTEIRDTPLSVTPWIANGATQGVEIESAARLHAQLLLSSSLGTTPLRWHVVVRPTVEAESTAGAPIANDAVLLRALRKYQRYSQVLDERGRGRIELDARDAATSPLYGCVAVFDDDHQILAVSAAIQLR